MARHGKLIAVPANPVLNNGSIKVKGSNSKCGKGSQTVPNCSNNPGLIESTSSLALTRWEMESP